MSNKYFGSSPSTATYENTKHLKAILCTTSTQLHKNVLDHYFVMSRAAFARQNNAVHVEVYFPGRLTENDPPFADRKYGRRISHQLSQ